MMGADDEIWADDMWVEDADWSEALLRKAEAELTPEAFAAFRESVGAAEMPPDWYERGMPIQGRDEGDDDADWEEDDDGEWRLSCSRCGYDTRDE